MTGPTPEDLEDNLADNWKFTRDLAGRITKLETRQAADDAVSRWRQWAIPLALSALAVAIALAGLLIPHHR